MRKVFVFCMVCSLPFLVLGCGYGQSGNGAGAQEQVGALPNYGFESDVMPMAEIGRVFEEMGREMQQNGSATFLGVTYPLTGNGHIEFGINRRAQGDQGLRTSFGVEFASTGQPEPPERRRGVANTHYEGRMADGTPAQIADALDQFAESLATTGAFAWDFSSVDFAGTAIIDQYLGQNTRNPRQPYRFEMEITFGEGEVQRHDDREDQEEALDAGEAVLLGNTSVEGADQATVVESLRALSAALRAGQLVVGGGTADIGDQARLGFAHVEVPGGSHKIEMGLQWPSLPAPPPQEPATGPSYNEETSMPTAEFAAMLQRIATEILASGSFTLEGETYTVGDSIGGEISFTPRGMTIEMGYRR
ncbi:MAG: hypothetical protein ABIF09_09705 [Gemmatimonadota bacterium]